MPRNQHQQREQNNFWKGDAADPDTGRDRARRWFPLPTVCCECEVAPATERHHLDGNPLNNTNNVLPVCRRCHMRLDGRLETMPHGPKPKPPKPCRECGKPWKPLNRGLCNACYLRWWRAQR